MMSNQSAGRDGVRHALAELRAGHDELQGLVSAIFDRFNELSDEFLGPKGIRGRQPQEAELETLQREIERLASVAAEMAKSAVGQKRQTAPRKYGFSE